MRAFLSHTPDGEILVQARPVSEDGKAVGDLVRYVGPGEEFLGHGYDDLKALGQNAVELEPKDA